MIKEIFALYLTFSSPTGDVEKFVKQLPDCNKVKVIAEEEFKKLNMDRKKLSYSGYMCIGWVHHLARQRYITNINMPDPVPKPVIIQPNCVVPIRE